MVLNLMEYFWYLSENIFPLELMLSNYLRRSDTIVCLPVCGIPSAYIPSVVVPDQLKKSY